MQAIQTQNEKIVDFYPYKLSVYEIPGNSLRIAVSIRRLNGGEFVQSDKDAIESIFRDIGKWEAFVNTASGVLAELGIGQPAATTRIIEYSGDKFVFDEEGGSHGADLRRYYMRMSANERHMREAMSTPGPTSGEIAPQLENVKKWRSVTQTVKLLRSLIPATD
jgi:hypothetical protein